MNHQTSERRHQISCAFEQCFGAAPSVWVRAPGRVDLMGSHTDYNLGCVLTLPIGLDTWIAARPRPDRIVRLLSLNLQAQAQVNLDQPQRNPSAPWSDYVSGVALALRQENLDLSGFDAILHSTVPLRSGLSSSAALECAAATLFQALGRWPLDPVRKALLCQRAENQFVGVNCGILDQYTSCVGQAGCALLLDCRDLSSRPVKLADPIQVVVCNTNYQRELVASEYGRRRAQCEQGARLMGVTSLRQLTRQQFEQAQTTLPPEVAKRCRFIVEENQRVLDLAPALETGDSPAIHRLCADSFSGASELYEICVPAMHAMLAAILEAPGVIGARQAGAGFGGCLVAFVQKPQTPEFLQTVHEGYLKRTRIQPSIVPVTAAAGAEFLDPLST